MDGVKTLEDTVTAAVAEADGLPTEASIRQMIQRVRAGAAALATISDSEAEAVARRIETRFREPLSYSRYGRAETTMRIWPR